MPVSVKKIVLAQHNCAGCRGKGKKAQQRREHAEKSVINQI